MQAGIAVSSLLTAAACLYGAAPASAQGNTGFYLEGNLGYAFPESVDASASGIDGKVELKDAFVFGGALGYRFPWVRLELNGSYRKFDTDKVKAQGQSVSGNGDATAVVGLFNVYLDPDLGVPVRPYLGGGIGGAYVKLDTGDNSLLSVDDEAGAFAWDLAAGVSYDVSGARHTKRRIPLLAVRGDRLLSQRRRRRYGRRRRRRRHLPRDPDRAALHLLSE